MHGHKYYAIYEAKKPTWLNNLSHDYLGELKITLDDDESLCGWIFAAQELVGKPTYYAVIGNKKIALKQHLAHRAAGNIQPQAVSNTLYPTAPLPKIPPLQDSLLNVLGDFTDFSLYAPVRADVYIDLSDDGDIVEITWSDDRVLLPRPADRTSNVLPSLAWDNIDYALPATNKKHQAWADLLLNGRFTESGGNNVQLSCGIDHSCPVIASMVRFLGKHQAVDPNLIMAKRPKSKGLINKPMICYRHHASQTLVAHTDSVRAMAMELFGSEETTTQTPVMMLNGNTVRIFSKPPETAISYGIIPTAPKKQAYIAHDSFKKIVNSKSFVEVGDVGMALVADDNEQDLLGAIFKRLFIYEGMAGRDQALELMARFEGFVPSRNKLYRFFAVDLQSKGSVRTLLALKIDEKSLCECLLRAINTTTPPNAHIVGYWFFDDSYKQNKALLQELLKFTFGMIDRPPRQLIEAGKDAIKNQPLSGFEFYALKHFLVNLGCYD